LARHAPKEFFYIALLKDSKHHLAMVGKWQEVLVDLKGHEAATALPTTIK
jgi:hypothetical protein